MSKPTRGTAVHRHDEDLLIPVGNETVAATRYEPTSAAGPLPVLLCYTPYRKDDRSFWNYHPYVTYLAEQGYEVVVADLVGTGASSGIKKRPFSTDEGDQAVEIIEWLADREWTDGRVGMFGHSYPGMTAIRAATKHPDALRAIVTMYSAYTTYERRGVLSSSLISGGAVGYQASMRWLPTMQAMQAMPPRRRYDDDGRWADVWEERLDHLREEPPWLFQYLDHESPKDEYWAGQDVTVEEIESITVPHFAIGGFRDTYIHPVTKHVQRMQGPTRLVLGPWRHTVPNDGRETAIDFYARMGEWFDHFVKGEETAALDHPSVEYWTERDGGGKIGGGVWRGGDRWHEAGDDVETVSFAIAPEGLVPAEQYAAGEVEREQEYDHSVGMDSLVREGPPTMTNSDDGRSVCFDSAPLADPVEIAGTGSATVRIASTTPDPILGVRVVDVNPDGAGSLVSYGHLRASHHLSHEAPEPLVPGDEYEITLPLHPAAHVFEAGHRIRLAVSAAYFPLMLPTGDHGTLTTLSEPNAPTAVRFPGRVHEGGVSFDDLVELSPPARTGHETLSQTAVETSREHAASTGMFRKAERREESLPFADMRYVVDERASVQSSDPASAVCTNETEFVLDYDTEQFRVEVRSSVSRDTTQISTRVSRDDHTIFDETWLR